MASGLRDGRPPAGLLVAGGFAVTVLKCAVVAAAVPGTRARVWVMAAVVTAFAARARSLPAGLATAVTAWCFTTGFLVNTLGTLTFGRSDLVRLGVFAVGGLGGRRAAPAPAGSPAGRSRFRSGSRSRSRSRSGRTSRSGTSTTVR
ncbi:hypothetical protein [Nonomuraea aridisoli]|uniref:Uncharacterized protein n=1 Tax=Nonomuraea aridisoli TaxID=2070368 RepID=A0A2W2FA95_9ACTN|nr:hypothetical protein [Nonomuraea aridisoli]PZG18507.1 hypothetical protein C1J01_14725 [Nonomuraea aridisoli]